MDLSFRLKKMAFANINGFDLYYEIHGKGDPVILLHHGFGCTRMWEDIFPALIENGYQVVLYDRKGYGRSQREDDFIENFYISDGFRSGAVDDLAALARLLGLTSFHLIGQCEGGVVAVDYAAAHPGQVKSIVMSSTQCYSQQPMTEVNRRVFPKGFHILEPEWQTKLKDWHGADYTEAFYNQFIRFGGEYGTGVFDLRPVLPSVACPFLILYPDRSAIFNVEQGVMFYRHLPAGELAVLPGCGHNTYENFPREYTRQVLNFYQRHGY
jgi:pimeloyl-ACP methyl ester carboxylesterase